MNRTKFVNLNNNNMNNNNNNNKWESDKTGEEVRLWHTDKIHCAFLLSSS